MKKLYYLLIMFAIAVTANLAISCSDDPGAENYYTSTKEYASDFLTNNSDKFSKFIEILNRATGEKGTYRLMDLLGTYGSYTVFAPTNEAIDAFLQSKGVSSVAELSKEDCDTLALNHIIEQEYFTTDYNNGTYPLPNMLERYLTITCDSDTVSVPGQVRLALRINKNALLSHVDDSVKNGVVHVLSSVISTQNDMLPDVMERDSAISLFYQAMLATNYCNVLRENYIDQRYERCKSPLFEKDSIDWTNDKLCLATAVEYDNVAYMKHRYFKYSAFIEPNSVYEEKYNITTLDGIRQLAKERYQPMYPDDENVTDETDPRNYLNRYVRYHFLPFQATYYQFTCVDGPNSTLAGLFNRRKIDIADWYEACMEHSVMKFSFPLGAESGLYINRRGVMNRPDEKGVKIRGAKVASPDQMPDNMSLNGVYYYIDDVIAYDEQTQNKVISGERMRMDGSTLSPDFMTSGARGHYTTSTIENGKYGRGGQGAKAASNCNHCLGFKGGFAKNFVYSDNITHLHVRNRVLSFWSFEGDELTIIGQFDIAVKMPPVPEGDWEIRIFSCYGFNNRGIIQFYFGPGKEVDGKVLGDLQPCGIPLDMRPGGENARVGWKSDSSLGDEDAIAAFDKAFRNRGWMKGMGCYGSGASGETGGGMGTAFRQQNNTLRKIITRFHSDGKSDYWLRCQQKLESVTNTMNFDALELCPSSVYNNEYYAEDRW
ncbi:MAG: fasciclin domain-containing protein [Bacteroidales bacterium]|nr:fasciclin domain-containing protein [Bacteroidales bacterium]